MFVLESMKRMESCSANESFQCLIFSLGTNMSYFGITSINPSGRSLFSFISTSKTMLVMRIKVWWMLYRIRSKLCLGLKVYTCISTSPNLLEIGGVCCEKNHCHNLYRFEKFIKFGVFFVFKESSESL